MGRLSKIDWDIIDGRINHAQTQQNLKNRSMALLWIVLEQYFPSLEDRLAEVITDGQDDKGIDAINIVEGEGYAEIYLFQSKCRENLDGTSKTLNDAEVLKISLFIEQLFDKSDVLKDCGNFRLRQAVEQIWLLHERGIYCRYQIVFCTNDQGLSQSATSIIESICQKHSQVGYEFYGPSDLIRDVTLQGKRRETGYLQAIGKETLERIDGDIRGVIASVDANSFVELIKTSDGKSVKRYLFDENLRIFLGANGGHNSAIIATATSDDSHLFWYLNNGITITCKNYSYNKGHVSPKIKIEDFQIVNGAQTSHSLIEASRINPEALSNVVLTVRIYATDRKGVAERVAVATNSQARIQSRDLRANHPTLKKLELAFRDKGYFFERKKNLYSDQEQKVRVDALKLGQIVMAYYLGEPDRAKAESDTIFDAKFSEIFHDAHDIDELCRLFEMYSIIEDMRADYVLNEPRTESGGELQYLVYGNWFVLFAVRLIQSRTTNAVPEAHKMKDIILEAVNLVARACNQSKAVAHYQMFRSPKTREKIFEEFYGKQIDLFESLAIR
jgi:hypothetical protein